MNTELKPEQEQTFGCESCPIRAKAEANPQSFMAKLWRWHTKWCPGWKAYQTYLAEQGAVQADN